MKTHKIIVLGPFVGKGYKVLRTIQRFCDRLEEFGTRVLLVPDLFPVSDPDAYTSEEGRLNSCKAIDASSAALLVFLSPETLGIAPGEHDSVGGHAWEFGVIYEQVRKGRVFYAAFLFDGEECRSKVSKLLQGQWQGRDLEAVASRPGDISELCELALQLCISLVNRLEAQHRDFS